MKKLTLVVLASLLVLCAGNALAVPVIDGVNSLGEWTSGLILTATDINEVGIPDAYDISNLKIIRESTGGASDGYYLLWELYGTPTFTSLDPFNINPVIYRTGLDMNSDGDFLDAVDRRIEYRSTGLVIYDGTGAVISGSPSAVMGSVVEFYAPSGMFASFPDNGFDGFLLLDNGGSPADDQLPDTGYFRTPEPGSAMLLGLGLLGFAGAIRRKFMA